MMDSQNQVRQNNQQKPKKKEGCEIDISQGKNGKKKIRISDGCKKEHLEAARNDL